MPSKSSVFRRSTRMGIRYGMLRVRSSDRTKNSLITSAANSLHFSILSDNRFNNGFYSYGNNSWYTLFGAFDFACTKIWYNRINANLRFCPSSMFDKLPNSR